MTPLRNDKRRLLYAAKRRLGLSEEDFRALLLTYGGSERTSNLDVRGFTAVMDRFRELGFVSEARKQNFGDRTGMASPAQVVMIRALWREAMEDPTNRALDNFIFRKFGVSALRFLDSGRAPHVITALKSMKARREKSAL